MPAKEDPDQSEAPASSPPGLPLASPDRGEEIQSVTPAPVVPSAADVGMRMVGLGGSAGSIPALQAFFRIMPPDSGMAFVVVIHLSPEHESTMASLLQQTTKMRVRQAEDGMPVEANCVYVIPPGKHLTSADGHLRLTELAPEKGRRVAVDLFFRSLADSHGPNAAAIVLSGADGDGTIGIKRIKERGGLTVAQDPDEAEHRAMPQAAISTGMVDWVLSVSEMPARLQDYDTRKTRLQVPPEEGPPPAEPPVATEDQSEEALRAVLAHLRTRTGRDFSYYKRATIVRRLARRMQVSAVDDLHAYLTILRTHPGEAAALLQDLLISVTNFFRDRETFEAIAGKIPALFHGKGPKDTLRVWVPACATGEEAYSLAMLLLEHAKTLAEAPGIQIFASDLDESAIQTGRAGLYPETIAADVSEERLHRFFVKEARGYRIRREVREIVLFAAHDLLKDAPFSRIDLVSCRNLLIYLNREAQRRAFDIFHFSLTPGGLLLLGLSESAEEVSALFNVLDKKHRIYAHRPIPRTGKPLPTGASAVIRALEAQELARGGPVLPGPSFAEVLAPPAQSVPPPGPSMAEVHFRLLERYAPPSLIVNAEYDIVHLSPNAGSFLQFTGGDPTTNLLRVVHPMLRIELRAALFQATETASSVEVKQLAFEVEGRMKAVNLRVLPAHEVAPGFLLVVFDPVEHEPSPAREARGSAEPVAQRLERELDHARAQLRDTIQQHEAHSEELRASNEELQAMNEELRSTTEELETSREEAQSINEELSTVNGELKNKIDELGQANSDLHNLMASTAIATVFLDRSLRIMRYTPAALELFHIIPSDVGRPLADLRNEIDYPQLSEDARRVLNQLAPVEREARDASGRWFMARLLPYRTLDDHIGGVVLNFVDITARKQAEAALSLSEEVFRRAIEEAPIPVIMHAEDGQVLQISNTWTELTGYSREEIPTFEAWLNTAYGHGAENVRDYVYHLFRKSERLNNVELNVKTRSGQIRCWSFSASAPGKLRDGRRFVVGMAVDITERRQTEEALEQHREHLRMIIENARDYAIISLDLQRRVTSWNAGAEAILGYTEQEIVGKTGDLIFTPEDRAAGAPAEEALKALHHGRAADERWHCRKNGATFWGSGVMVPMRDPAGTVTGFVKIFRDQTGELETRKALDESHAQLRKALQKAERARREADTANLAKDQFLATLSHELRTPLVPILMTAESLLKAKDLAPRVREGLERICRNVELETHFINDLLDLTRISRGKFELACVPVDTHEVLCAAADICQSELEKKQQKLSFDLQAVQTQVLGDSARLQQVFWNILKNASKFTPAQGEIFLGSSNEPGVVIITIRDNGIGIAPGELKNIFEAFRQGDGTIAREFGGLGLGLAIAKATVGHLGGEIFAQSTGPGTGSTFTVRLPLKS